MFEQYKRNVKAGKVPAWVPITLYILTIALLFLLYSEVKNLISRSGDGKQGTCQSCRG